MVNTTIPYSFIKCVLIQLVNIFNPTALSILSLILSMYPILIYLPINCMFLFFNLFSLGKKVAISQRFNEASLPSV